MGNISKYPSLGSHLLHRIMRQRARSLGFCKYSDLGCESCVPWAMPVAELTKWSTPAGEKFAEERQAWIKMGEESTVVRSQIQGVTLCGCNIEVVIALFQALTPDEWALADNIAPWIFKRSE